MSDTEINIKTWAGKSTFTYKGCVAVGTDISFGTVPSVVKVSAQQYSNLRKNFLGKVVAVGTSFDNPPPGSIGEWLQSHVTRTAIASYVASILIREGYAIKENDKEIRFVR